MGKLLEIFDELISLDEKEMEMAVKHIKNRFIEEMNCKKIEKINQFQWEVENILRQYKNDVSKNNILLGMLMDKLQELDELLNGSD